MRDAGTLCERFQATVAEHGDAVALRSSDGAISLTWREYGARVRRIAAGLAALGVGRGDTVGLMMTNRPEFNLVDAAVFHLGATPYSIYNTAAPDQITHVLSNAGSSVVVCDAEFQDRIHTAATGTKVDQVVTVEQVDGADLSLAELEASGEDDFDFDAAWQAVTPDDVLTLIYTSGTTGPPKGVELTHANLIASSASLNEVKAHSHTDRVVSYLPDAHIVNRYVAHYLPALTGLTVTTIRDPKQMLAALTDVRPTVFVAVPMLWYKIKAALEGAVAESGGAKQRLAEWAIDTGRRRARLASARQPIPAGLELQHALADRLVLAKLKHRLGVDKIEIAISGAAPIAEEAMEFILALGIPVCEGWGMSELCAFATVNRPGSQRIGTVGLPGPGIEVRLADDGELLVRGPMVMKGYRNEPQLTAETVDRDGWMHTGDIGTIDDDGYITIVDRKKELIINDGGKNMSPSNIENHLKVACPLAGSVVAIGDQRKYVTALVTLDADAAAAYAERQGLTDASPEALAADPGVHATVVAGVEAANAKLSRVEQIKKFTIVPMFWEPGSDELTPTLKLRRKPIATKYADLIDQMYTS